MFLSDAAKRVGQFFVNLLEILIDDNDCHLKHLILTTRLQLPEGSCLLRHGYKKNQTFDTFLENKKMQHQYLPEDCRRVTVCCSPVLCIYPLLTIFRIICNGEVLLDVWSFDANVTDIPLD